MTLNEKFDAVAPIAIYHFADLLYEKKAKIGLAALLKGGVFPADMEGETPTIDNVAGWSKDLYDSLFNEILDEEIPDNNVKHDRWGAKAVYDASEAPIFSGDGQNELPWYETAELLRKRLQVHLQEAAA